MLKQILLDTFDLSNRKGNRIKEDKEKNGEEEGGKQFLEWLKQQGYWVSREELDKEFEVYYMNMEGVTMKKGEDGKVLMPRRDLRNGFVSGRIVIE